MCEMLPEKQWEQVKAIFQTAIEMEPDERQAYVIAKCGDDATLMDEVGSMLSAHDGAGDFIATPVAMIAHDLIRGPDRPSRIGQTIGAYRIESEIGRGGMGAVFLAARADDQFKKRVAVKLIKRGFDTDEIIARFRAERQILATLDHPHITRLIDGGATGDGLPFLVMDYVDGLSLSAYARQNMLSIGQRLELFLKICSAVEYAHQNLVIHRDIKPSNILVTPDGMPKLLDFGVAKLISGDPGDDTGERSGVRAMTPEYAAPEQILGKMVTTAADIYSLGVVLYELLTERRPFVLKGRPADEIARLITDSEPIRPSDAYAATDGAHDRDRAMPFQPSQLKGDLDNIVLMAMRKVPERRYSSVGQFAEDIRRFLDGRPIIAREDTFGYRAGKFVNRNKAGVAAGAGIFVSLVGGIVAASSQARRARRQRDRAQKVNSFLQEMLASADPNKQGKDIKVIEILELASNNIEKDFAGEPAIAADLRTTIGLTFLNLGQISSAEEHLQYALSTRRRIFGSNALQTAISQNNFGKLLQAKGDMARAEELFRRALATMRRSRRADDLEMASVYGNLGYLLMLSARYGESEAAYSEELRIRRAIVGERHPDFARTLSNLANILAVTGNRADAEPLHRRALEVMRNYYGGEHPDVALALLHLVGSIQFSKPDEAERLCRESLAIRQRFFGDGHIEVAWSLYYLVLVLMFKGEYDRAMARAGEILAGRGRSIPDTHSVINSTLLLAGQCFLKTGRPDDAEPLIVESLELRRQTLPHGHWLIATTKNYLAQCYFQQGRLDEAVPLMRSSYDEIRAKLGDDNEHAVKARRRLERSEALMRR